jgi:hypothetical protein
VNVIYDRLTPFQHGGAGSAVLLSVQDSIGNSLGFGSIPDWNRFAVPPEPTGGVATINLGELPPGTYSGLKLYEMYQNGGTFQVRSYVIPDFTVVPQNNNPVFDIFFTINGMNDAFYEVGQQAQFQVDMGVYNPGTYPNAECRYRITREGTFPFFIEEPVVPSTIGDWIPINCNEYQNGKFVKPATFVEASAHLDLTPDTENIVYFQARQAPSATWNQIERHIKVIAMPSPPIVTGPVYLAPWTNGVYTLVTSDSPAFPNIEYEIDWDGDGFFESRSLGGFGPSDVPKIVTNSFPSGTYTARFKTVTDSGIESEVVQKVINVADGFPPSDPIILGPSNVVRGVSNTYTLQSDDPDGGFLRYVIDWNRNNATFNPVFGDDTQVMEMSGIGVNVSRIFNILSPPSYPFDVWAVDETGLHSNKVTHTVNVTNLSAQLRLWGTPGAGSVLINGITRCTFTLANPSCVYTLPRNQPYLLTAETNAGFEFREWDGSAFGFPCQGSNTSNCSFALNSSQDVNLLFNDLTPNTPPAVNAGPDQTMSPTANSVILNGSAFDADGDSLTYAWTNSSKPTGAVNPIISSPQALSTNVTSLNTVGDYWFLLTADDGTVVSGDTVKITVNSVANQNGICGAANNKKYAAAPPVAYRCAVGTNSGFITTGTGWRWKCDGVNGGAQSGFCNATKLKTDFIETN